MAQSQFSLKWEAHRKNICAGLSSLQQIGGFVDMTLAADGHLVKVHQVIIALASPYLRELISSVQCQHPVILLNKISYKTLCALLEYIYTGEVLISIENLNELVDAGKELHIKGLEDMNLHNDDNSRTISHSTETNSNNIMEEIDEDSSYLEITNPINNETETYVMDEANNDVQCVKDSSSFRIFPEVTIASDNLMIKNEYQTSVPTEPHYPPEQPSVVNFVKVINTPKPSQTSSVLQYTVSNQGNIQIILNRYMYYLKHVNKNGKRHWRCLNYLHRMRCPAHVITKEDMVLQRISAHTHPFHDKKILKKIRASAIYSAIQEAEQEGLVVRQKCKDDHGKDKSNDDDTD